MKGKGKSTKRKSIWAYKQLEELFEKPGQVEPKQGASKDEETEQQQREMEMGKGIDQDTEMGQKEKGEDKIQQNWQLDTQAQETSQWREDHTKEGKQIDPENKMGGSCVEQSQESMPYEQAGYGQKKRQRTILEYMEATQQGRQERSISRNQERDGQQEVHKEKWTKEDDQQGTARDRGAADKHGSMMVTGLDKQWEGHVGDEMQSPGTI